MSAARSDRVADSDVGLDGTTRGYDEQNPARGGVCPVCERARATDLHHVVPRSLCPRALRGHPANLLPLCHTCHMGHHDGLVTIHRDVLSPTCWNLVRTIIGPAWLDKRYPVRYPADAR